MALGVWGTDKKRPPVISTSTCKGAFLTAVETIERAVEVCKARGTGDQIATWPAESEITRMCLCMHTTLLLNGGGGGGGGAPRLSKPSTI